MTTFAKVFNYDGTWWELGNRMMTISPCPNCGNVRTKTFVDAPWKAHCYCNKCWFSGPECVGQNSREAAIHAWNRMSLAAQLMEAVEHKIQCEDAHHLVWHSGPVNASAGQESVAALNAATTTVDLLMFEVARHMRRQDRAQENEVIE